MPEDRRRILAMLAEGRISADQADRLLGALTQSATPSERPSVGARPRYLRVEVDAQNGGESPKRVNIRVPMTFLRAGVRLAALIPPAARDQVNAAMHRSGVPFDIDQLKPENLETLVEHLGDFSVDVDDRGAKVRLYCE